MIKKVIKGIKDTAKANDVNAMLLAIVMLIITIPGCIVYLFLSLIEAYKEKRIIKKLYKEENNKVVNE